MLSDAARSIWAKTDQAGLGRWLSLAQHLADTGAVCGYLWSNWLSDGSRATLSHSVDLSPDECCRLAVFLAAAHDIGKATPDFARQAEVVQPELLARMADEGLSIGRVPVEKLGHQLSGQRLLRNWIVQRYATKPRYADTLATIIGGHHGVNPTDQMLNLVETRPALLGDEAWATAREELLAEALAVSGAEAVLSKVVEAGIPAHAQVLLTGLVIVSDWIASNEALFPYGDPAPTPQRLAAAMSGLNLQRPWRPKTPVGTATELLRQRFAGLGDASARPIQQALFDLARRAQSPCLSIVEAKMGDGKTEAALLGGEVLASRFGLGGVFVALPTMATSNPMFDRVLAWLGTVLGDEDASVALVHGKAALNESFTQLIAEAWRGELWDDDSSDRQGRAVVNSWLMGRKRSALASFVVGTIDQALFAALKARHVVLRHLGLVGKVVIIDEVHAADDYMRAYLKSVLAWLGASRTPVILMSATLPPDQRNELIRAYARGTGDHRDLTTDTSDAYPRITTYAGELETVHVPADARSKSVVVERIPDEVDNLVDQLRSLLRDGGCAGVVCNTVSRAQEAYLQLNDAFPGEVLLCHSRFIATDRLTREAAIVKQLGRDGADRPKRLIVVGTQVLEQSIDVDFDVMVSDLAPIDLLMQRIGRLHRHERHRPDKLRFPQTLLRGVEDWHGRPIQAVAGSRAIYGADRLMRAAAVLLDREQVVLPSDIPRLVRLAYDREMSAPDGWQAAWASAEESAASERAKALARASAYLLSEPRRYSTLNGLVEVAAKDPEDAVAQGQSQVRDSDEGLEVIVLFRDDNGLLRVPESAPRFASRVVPTNLEWVPADEPLAKSMASCTLPLPAAMCMPSKIQSVIDALENQAFLAGWQSSRWLRGQLALVFDTQGDAHVADYSLHYDQEQGLVFQQMEKPR